MVMAKSKKSATKKIDKYDKKFKVNMTFEDAIKNVIRQPLKNTKANQKDRSDK